jgi:hypothetical protein
MLADAAMRRDLTLSIIEIVEELESVDANHAGHI